MPKQNAPKANAKTKVKANEEGSRPKRAYLRADERKSRIIEAVQKVFSESSFQGATTRNLAKAADVNIATLFHHFESKEGLFMAAVVEPLLEIMRNSSQDPDLLTATTPQKLSQAILPWIDTHLRTMIEIFPLLSVALFSDPALGERIYCEHIYPMLQRRSESLRASLDESLDPDLVILAGFGIELAVAMDRAFRHRTDDPSEIATQIRNIVFSHPSKFQDKK